MKFYRPSDDYLKNLHQIDHRIIYSPKVLGIPLRINELIYFLPIDSLDQSDYDENNIIKKSTPTILRMYDLKKNIYYGKCLFSNMFAIPYNELLPLDKNDLYLEDMNLINKKIDIIKKNIDRIERFAIRLYKQKTRNYNQPYLKATVDFMRIETFCIEWEIQHYGKHINRFPDQQFFLTNPYTEGVTSYYLMNKEKRVLQILIDNKNQKVIKLEKIINENYAPLECFGNGVLNEKDINTWFVGRGIPSWRDGLDDFLDNLGIKNKDILLNKAYGLSLSDQYWMNPVDRPMDYHEINFFDHDFNSRDYLQASFENKIIDINKVDFYSPNNTSEGMLKKAWIVGQDKKRYLLKSSFRHKGMEPFNEVLGCMISEVLDFDHVTYTLEKINGDIVSKCECFIDKNTEFISAYAILKYYYLIDLNDIDIYKSYIKILEDNHLQNVENQLCKMFILDYLIVNDDRHLGNFGIIRNVETLQWMKIAPNFDNGQSMFSQSEIYDMDFENPSGRFFNESVNFEKILDYVLEDQSIHIDFDTLKKIPLKWKKILLEYQDISMITDERIDRLINGLYVRIDRLQNRLLFKIKK